MSITVNVVGQTNIVTSITNSDTVDVAVGTFVAQAVTGLLVAAGDNVTVTTTDGVFTIAAADPPVTSVNGKTGVVSLTYSDVLAAAQSHTHTAANVTDFATEAAKHGPVSSVAGKTGTVTLVSTDVSAASAVHTHVVADITDFAVGATAYGPVVSVNGQTGTVTLTAADISAASATHAHSYVQDLNGQTGTLSIVAGDNITVTTSAGSITITGVSGSTSVAGQVSSVNGQTGTVTLVSTDVSAASAVHAHVASDVTDFATEAALYGPVVSVNGQTGTVSISVDGSGTSVSVGSKTVTASVNNYDAGTTSIVRVEATTNLSITGLAGGEEGVVKLFVNVGTNEVTIASASTASEATNRFIVTGGDRLLREGDSASTFYDATSQRWRLIAHEPAAPPLLWTTVTATGNLNNYAPGTATVLRIDPTSARLVTGITDGGVNKAVRIVNVATNILTLVHESTSSDSQNRLLVDTGTDRDIDENEQAELLYDPISLRWRVSPCCGSSS